MVLIGMVGYDTNNDTTPTAILEKPFGSMARGFCDRPCGRLANPTKCQPDEWLQTAIQPMFCRYGRMALGDVEGPFLLCVRYMTAAQGSRR